MQPHQDYTQGVLTAAAAEAVWLATLSLLARRKPKTVKTADPSAVTDMPSPGSPMAALLQGNPRTWKHDVARGMFGELLRRGWIIAADGMIRIGEPREGDVLSEYEDAAYQRIRTLIEAEASGAASARAVFLSVFTGEAIPRPAGRGSLFDGTLNEAKRRGYVGERNGDGVRGVMLILGMIVGLFAGSILIALISQVTPTPITVILAIVIVLVGVLQGIAAPAVRNDALTPLGRQVAATLPPRAMDGAALQAAAIVNSSRRRESGRKQKPADYRRIRHEHPGEILTPLREKVEQFDD